MARCAARGPCPAAQHPSARPGLGPGGRAPARGQFSSPSVLKGTRTEPPAPCRAHSPLHLGPGVGAAPMGVPLQHVPGGSSGPTVPCLACAPGCTRGLYRAERRSTCVDLEGQSQGSEWLVPSLPKARPDTSGMAAGPRTGARRVLHRAGQQSSPRRPRAQGAALHPLHKGVSRAMPPASPPNQPVRVRVKVESTSEK